MPPEPPTPVPTSSAPHTFSFELEVTNYVFMYIQISTYIYIHTHKHHFAQPILAPTSQLVFPIFPIENSASTSFSQDFSAGFPFFNKKSSILHTKLNPNFENPT